ncbi:MAG: type II toxin-antitoxin system RatA family toxin [Gammaproteobacteria bacterium]
MAIVKRSIDIPYSPEQVYALVDDIKAYPEFISWCESCTVHHRDEDQVKASLVVAGGGIRKSFTTHNLLQHNKMIEIRLIDGPFKHLEGFWRFDLIDNGHCRIALDMEFEFAGKLLDFAFGPVFHQMTNKLVDLFCKRAEVVYGGSGD